MKFIGLDAHSGSSFFEIQNARGRVQRFGEVATRERDLLELVRSVRRPRRLICEEGVVSQWLYLLLKDEVDDLVICRPPERHGAKTDRIDAHHLANDLRQERFVRVFHSDHEFMELRTLVSAHQDVGRALTAAKNRYRALYRQSAIATPDAPSFYKDETRVSELPTQQQRVVAESLLRQIRALDDEKQDFEQRFAENGRRDPVVRLLMTIPGIGTTRANQLVSIIVTPDRFATKYCFFAYAMLVNHKQTSNGREYGTKKAKGQTLLKGLFYSAVFSVLKSDNAFRRKYHSMIERGLGTKAARQAVARAMAAAVLGVWKSGKPYDDGHREELTKRVCKSAVQSL